MIIDGHNDLVLRTWEGAGARHVELDRAAEAGFAGGFFALFVPGESRNPLPARVPYALPLEPPVPRARARALAEELLAVLEGLPVTIVRRPDGFEPGRVNAIVHLEGADPLAPDLSDLEHWYDRGLRSLGLTWSRANAFAEGVPFRFPSGPDTGPGLTQAGLALVHACNLRGILVDVSHLNEAGFWDVARASRAPLVATHSNVHALCPASRNLTDRQLDAIGASEGIVGVNFATPFLRADGAEDEGTPLEEIVRHLDYLVARIGVDHVGFGSDFDGATVPAALGGIAGFPALVALLEARGHDEEAVAKITHRNWLRVLEQTWHPWSRYLERAGSDPRETLLDALARFAAPGLAVDLGAGSGRDTAELLRRGWSVIAIDREPDAIERLRRLAGGDSPRLEARVARFEDSEWPVCDLVNASFALPFCPPAAFPALWERIVGSIRPGGRFAGQLLGERDAWAGSGIVVTRREELEALFDGFELEGLREFEGEAGTVAGGPKHWHTFHVVAHRR